MVPNRNEDRVKVLVTAILITHYTVFKSIQQIYITIKCSYSMKKEGNVIKIYLQFLDCLPFRKLITKFVSNLDEYRTDPTGL